MSAIISAIVACVGMSAIVSAIGIRIDVCNSMSANVSAIGVSYIDSLSFFPERF